ncbi:endolytic transglycosylase MltG [Patescibacteria group bacterium AH-259-L05]|nr:endolytic transglycosylase MltG [Patescibacteria group bacterium AH-259-L05]
MKKKGIWLGYIIFALIIIFLYFSFQDSGGGEGKEREILFSIEKGQGVKEISERLEQEGFVKNSKLFQLYSFLSNARTKFLPGEYRLPREISFKELVGFLTSRPLAPETSVTIVEGLTNSEIAQVLEENDIVAQDDFFTALDELSQDQEFINTYEFLSDEVLNVPIDEARFQGYLFPDTYRFYQETSAEAVIRKMVKTFDEKLNTDIRAKVKGLDKSIHEVITLASIVEKEADLDQDRRLIADVFWSRLSINWALQSDATVNYILNTSKLQPTFEDTRTPSPYNTYLHPGLPPGPINNPSFSAISATVDPIENDYCCFLVTPDGINIFSLTIKEHNYNKAKYLK